MIDTLTVKNYTSDAITPQEYAEIEEFVVEQTKLHSADAAIENMGSKEYVGLLFHVKNKTRWTTNNGEIIVIKTNDKIVGISCVETSPFTNKLGIGGVRCWLDTEYRTNNTVTKYLLTNNLNWCRTMNMYGMLLSFNDYNKWIYDTIVRKSHGKSANLSGVWSDWWNDCIIVEKQINIRNTMQWCVIKPIVYDKSKEIAELLNRP